MDDLNNLLNRIDGEFTALEERYKKSQAEAMDAYRERQKRLAQLNQVFERLREVWKPRLDVLVAKLGDKVKVTPRLIPSTREATFEFQSKVARVRLRFSATTDRDITKVILSDDLDIIPILVRYDSHSALEFPLDAVDTEAIARWVDDRIVSFVKTYLSLHENDRYLEKEMVEDPVAGVRFPKFAAGATLEWNGQTYYFVGEETRREFEKKQGIGSK